MVPKYTSLEIQNNLVLKIKKHFILNKMNGHNFFTKKNQKPCIFKAFDQNPCISSVLGTN